MKLPFRVHHLHQFFSDWEKDPIPLDQALHLYFRKNKALGSKDRGYIAETVYGIIRWKGLLEGLGAATLQEKIEKLESGKRSPPSSLPKHQQLSFPQWLYEAIVRTYGVEEGEKICYESNFPAPLCLRINPLKTTREEVLELLRDYSPTPTPFSPYGILLPKRVNLFPLEAFQKGFFEVQDEGSQLLAALVQPKPGDQVLDYCSGSGGKTLAFAPLLEGKGQIYLHDIRKSMLIEAKKRLARAGIQNFQFLTDQKLKGKMDWVMVDVPCTGTGTLRRNPDIKWKIGPESVEDLARLQREIFEKGLSFVKKGGKIVYGTCSLLREENEEQVEHFLQTYPCTLQGDFFHSLPKNGGMDGLFGAVFCKL